MFVFSLVIVVRSVVVCRVLVVRSIGGHGGFRQRRGRVEFTGRGGISQFLKELQPVLVPQEKLVALAGALGLAFLFDQILGSLFGSLLGARIVPILVIGFSLDGEMDFSRMTAADQYRTEAFDDFAQAADGLGSENADLRVATAELSGLDMEKPVIVRNFPIEPDARKIEQPGLPQGGFDLFVQPPDLGLAHRLAAVPAIGSFRIGRIERVFLPLVVRRDVETHAERLQLARHRRGEKFLARRQQHPQGFQIRLRGVAFLMINLAEGLGLEQRAPVLRARAAQCELEDRGHVRDGGHSVHLGTEHAQVGDGGELRQRCEAGEVAFHTDEAQGGEAPDAIVAPLGGGTLLLGTHIGFGRLREAGMIERVPRLIGVQSAACSPLARAFRAGEPDAVAVTPGATIAEGIRIDRPPRSRQILAAIRETGGDIVDVSDDEIRDSMRELLAQGVFVEPTSAAAHAGLARTTIGDTGGTVVLAMTGHGLKATGPIAEILGT